MTLPNEARNSIKLGRCFLADLLDPKKTPKVPKSIRARAGNILRHYPFNIHIDQLTDENRAWLCKKFEEL